MFFHTGLQALVPQWDICLNIKFYMVYTMHCDTTVTIKTNKIHSCYKSILKKLHVLGHEGPFIRKTVVEYKHYGIQVYMVLW